MHLLPTATNGHASIVTPVTITKIQEYTHKDYNDIHYNDIYDQLQMKHLKTDSEFVTKPFLDSMQATLTVNHQDVSHQFSQENFDFSHLVETSSIFSMITAVIMIAIS